MKEHLAMAQDSAREAERLVMSKEAVIGQLRLANEEYSRRLSSMTAKLPVRDDEEIAALKENVERE
jgi:hypothetical protein